MELSPIQSSAKCSSSDFSIDRILSNESGKNKEQKIEPPSWLCCTRYQPPRLPRSASASCRSRRSGRHARVPFTAAQAQALEAAYTRSPYLAPPALRALAAALQLRDDRIKIWFQNRRARERREKTSTIAVPREVTLAPTAVFAPQSLLTIGAPWTSQPATESQENFQNMQLSPSSRRPNGSSMIPQEITFIPSTSRLLNRQEEFEQNNDTDRPDTPLDIENIE